MGKKLNSKEKENVLTDSALILDLRNAIENSGTVETLEVYFRLQQRYDQNRFFLFF